MVQMAQAAALFFVVFELPSPGLSPRRETPQNQGPNHTTTTQKGAVGKKIDVSKVLLFMAAAIFFRDFLRNAQKRD
jgi:hypothetical protein